MAELTEEILEGEATVEFDWKKTVWNLKLAPKIKMFSWKCLKGIIPVGERLLQHHLNVDSRCKRCGGSESINHLLFHCPFAREIWKLAPLEGGFGVSGLTDLRADWTVMHSLKCLPPTGITNSPLVPWILWSIWKARNRYVFENYAGNPVDVLTQAIVAAKEWSGAQDSVDKTPRPLLRKTSPQLDVVARTDAAWSESSGKAGLAWIVKHQEQSTRGQRGTSFVSSALIAEGLALRDAVTACCNHGLKRVEFESDSMQLITAINSKVPPLEIYGIAEDIQSLSLAFDVVVFVWIPREKNVEADLIAKSTLSLYEQEVVVKNLIPPPT